MKHFVVASLGIVSFAFADNCAQAYMKARPAADYYNHGYTLVKESNQDYDSGVLSATRDFDYYWNGTVNDQGMDSAKAVYSRWPEDNGTLSKESGYYALYKEEGSQGSMVSYSRKKKYSEGTIDFSSDTLVMSHVLYGDYDRAHFYTIKMHISNDTLHYYQDSYVGYPDTIAYPDTARRFLIDNPEKENHCLEYYYSSDKNEWVELSIDYSYAYKGDTLIFTRRVFDGDDSYEDMVNYLVSNSVLFDEQTTKIGLRKRKPYSILSKPEKFRDVKGRRHSKTGPHHVLFGVGE